MKRVAPFVQTQALDASASAPRRFSAWLLGGAAIGLAAVLVAVGALALGDVRTAAAIALVLAAASLAVMLLQWRAQGDRDRSDREKQLLTEAFNGIRAGRVIVDGEGRAIQANRVFRGFFPGLDEAGGKLRSLFSTSPDAGSEFDRMHRTAREGRSASSEIVLPLGSGERRWFNVLAEPLGGWPGHTQWRLEDVTSRREIDTTLREEQTKLTDFLDHAPIGFYSVDGDGRFLFVNATLAGWLDTRAADLVQGSVSLHGVLADPPKNAPGYAVTSDPDAREPGEVTLRSRNGRLFQAYVTQTIVRDETGAVRTRSVVRDLTMEHEWEEALRQSEHRFQRFFEDAPIGIALLDRDMRVTECNAAFLKMVGATEGGAKGRTVADFFEPDSADRAPQILKMLDGEDMAGPVDVRLRNESVASLFARRLDGPADQPDGFIFHFIDTTEQKNLELQFAQSQKMQAVGQLAGGVAHDFNNLLTAMIGFCDLLLLRHKPGDQSFGDIMHIKQNANRAANLVRQLLAFSRQQTLQPRILNITDALSELSNLLRRLIGENIELRMVHGRDLGLIRVDQGQFEQVVINLAVNARDAMPSGGLLTIATHNFESQNAIRRGAEVMPPGEYVAMDVIDTGTGIAAEHIGRIFEPFFSTKEVGSGTGLGLSTVYGIVRQTGGFIFVDSTPGEGAKFSIYLPRHQPKPEEAAPEALDGRDRGSSDLTGVGSILLVEDEDAVRMFSARALRNKGYNVLEANSGQQALEVLANPSNRIDLLISDVVMPQMDGPTLVRKVRESMPDLRVILISGYTEDKFRQHFGDGETVHFLPKPFTLKQLAGKVKDVLREND